MLVGFVQHSCFSVVLFHCLMLNSRLFSFLLLEYQCPYYWMRLAVGLRRVGNLLWVGNDPNNPQTSTNLRHCAISALGKQTWQSCKRANWQ